MLEAGKGWSTYHGGRHHVILEADIGWPAYQGGRHPVILEAGIVWPTHYGSHNKMWFARARVHLGRNS